MDEIQDLVGVEPEAVVFDEIEHEINLEIEVERKVMYGKEFGIWA